MTVPAVFETPDWKIRAIDHEGRPWFVAKDVALTLGYRDAYNMCRYVKPEERSTAPVGTTKGVHQLAVIDEHGLLRVAHAARNRPIAGPFRLWVTNTLLPAFHPTVTSVLPATTTAAATAECDGQEPLVFTPVSEPELVESDTTETGRATDIQVVDIDGEPWFVGDDVARALGHRGSPMVTRRLEPGEHRRIRVPGRWARPMTVYSLRGLHRAVYGGNKDAPEVLRRWVDDQSAHHASGWPGRSTTSEPSATPAEVVDPVQATEAPQPFAALPTRPASLAQRAGDVVPAVFETADWSVRVIDLNGEPWFVAADVAKALGYRDAANLTRRLDLDERGTHSVSTPSGDQQMNVINESGVYTAILGSRIDQAKAFKRWVTHDVLPTIRRTGSYYPSVSPQFEVPATYSAALRAAAEQAERAEAAEWRAGVAEAELIEAAPKVEAYDLFIDSQGNMSMLTAAKSLNVGRTTLMRQLREKGVLMSNRQPYRRHEKYFKVVQRTRLDHHGVLQRYDVTLVRPEGLDFIRRKLGLPAIQHELGPVASLTLDRAAGQGSSPLPDGA